jgi:hypothetical protein
MTDMDLEDDTLELESDNLSTSTFSNNSICDQIDNLIERCEQLHIHIHNSFDTIHTIKELVDTNLNINIVIDDKEKDLDIILEELHENAILKIKETGHSNFGEELLNIINNCDFR